jgi:hypothetical protein
VLIKGPENTPYVGTTLHIQITFLEGYPYSAPDLVFLTRIVSINFMMQLDGRARLLHLDAVWEPNWSLRKLLIYVVDMLAHPNSEYLPVRFKDIYNTWAARKQEMEVFSDSETLSFDQMTDDILRNRILQFPRVEQLHLSILFLNVSDPQSFHNYAQQIAQRFSYSVGNNKQMSNL